MDSGVFNKSKKAFDQMRKALYDAVMQDVGKKLLEEGRRQQQLLNDALILKLKDWEEIMRLEAKKILLEEKKKLESQ